MLFKKAAEIFAVIKSAFFADFAYGVEFAL